MLLILWLTTVLSLGDVLQPVRSARAVSDYARNGAGLVHVQRLMGHSDPKLTAQVYTHLDVEDLRGAIEGVIGR